MSGTRKRRCPLFEDQRLDRRWVAWRVEGRHGKETKVPYNPRNGRRAKSNDSSTWASLQLAAQFEPKAGIGIMLGDLGDGQALCGIDLDTCRDPDTGAFTAWAQEIIERLDSYVEISPSGTGAKIFLLAEAGFKGEQNSQREWDKAHPPAIDVFTSNRFFTVTQNCLGNRPLRSVDRNDIEWTISKGRTLSGKTENLKARLDPSDLSTLLTHQPLDLRTEEIWDVLDRLDHDAWCEDRAGWLRVGAALHHQFSGAIDGLAIWDEFSIRSQKFDGDDNERTWRSFKHRANPITFRSLIAEVGGMKKNREGAGVQFSRTFLSAEQLRELPRPYDFVQGLLFDGQLSVVYGQPATGKSFLVFDLASAVSQGRTWANRHVEQRDVLIIPLEGLGTLSDRVRAWEIDRGRKCRVSFSPEALDLRQLEKATAEIIDYVQNNRIGLVIIDTLARAMPGADENSFQDMSAAIEGADQIRRATGAHLLLVHHSGKDKDRGARGHSSLIGAADLMIEVRKTNGTDVREARVVKNRSGREGENIRFRLEEVTTDTKDARGISVSAPVVRIQNEHFSDLDDDELSPDEARLLRIVRHFTRFADIYDISDEKIPLKRIRRDMYAGGWRKEDKADTRKKAFLRLRTALAERGLIVEGEDWIELTPVAKRDMGKKRDKSRRPAVH